MVLCLFLLWMAESNCTYSFLEILSVTAMSETVALRLNFLHWASRRSQCVHCEVAHGRSKESQLFNCILVHPALMSPPPLSAHLSVPSRISQQPWAPVLLSRRVCVSPVKVLVTALCLKGRHDVIATVFVGVWITEEFHFLSLFTFDYSNAFRTLPPLAPQPPQSDMDWVIYPTHPRPTADDPSLWYSLISLGWSGLVNPANQNENEHKKSPRIYCTGPHFKGTVWVCVFVCMHVFVHVCVCERERHGAQERVGTARFIPFPASLSVKRCCRKIPKQKTHCRIPLRVRFPHSSTWCTENPDRGKSQRAPLLSSLVELPALTNSI